MRRLRLHALNWCLRVEMKIWNWMQRWHVMAERAILSAVGREALACDRVALTASLRTALVGRVAVLSDAAEREALIRAAEREYGPLFHLPAHEIRQWFS